MNGHGFGLGFLVGTVTLNNKMIEFLEFLDGKCTLRKNSSNSYLPTREKLFIAS